MGRGHSQKGLLYTRFYIDATTNPEQLSKIAGERKEERRCAFMMRVGVENPDRLVFVDETAVNLRSSYRLNGRSARGKRAYRVTNFVRGQRCVP